MKLKIKQLRKEKKLSQQEFAAKIDISVRMLAEYEKNNADIGIYKLKKIADIFDANFLELIDFENEELQIVSEPNSNYGMIENDLLATKNKIIELLEQENARLRNIIESKGIDESHSA